MPARMTIEEFDVYHEVRERMVKANAVNCGRLAYISTLRLLIAYPAVPEDAAYDVALGEATKAEVTYLDEWRKGQHQDMRGLGAGVRVLFRIPMDDQLAESLFPVPSKTGAPEVVEVLIPGQEDLGMG